MFIYINLNIIILLLSYNFDGLKFIIIWCNKSYDCRRRAGARQVRQHVLQRPHRRHVQVEGRKRVDGRVRGGTVENSRQQVHCGRLRCLHTRFVFVVFCLNLIWVRINFTTLKGFLTNLIKSVIIFYFDLQIISICKIANLS